MKRAMAAIAVMSAVLASAVLVRAQTSDKPLDPLVIAWDRGTDKIDVSRYPADIKRKFKTFNELCGRCHPIARAINCDFAIEDDWERYIKKMMRRGRGLVTPEEAQEAFEFAIYDSKIRKKDLYERKMKAIAGAAR